MNTKKTISPIFASLLIMVLCFTASNANAQAKADSTMMKDCCMMKDGKMIYMKDGKMMPMDREMTMKNGTKCMVNGECIMKNGKKMKMKERECIYMDGVMDKCGMTGTLEKKKAVATYRCPMHPEVTSDKPGKCSKCGMDLEKKK